MTGLALTPSDSTVSSAEYIVNSLISTKSWTWNCECLSTCKGNGKWHVEPAMLVYFPFVVSSPFCTARRGPQRQNRHTQHSELAQDSVWASAGLLSSWSSIDLTQRSFSGWILPIRPTCESKSRVWRDYDPSTYVTAGKLSVKLVLQLGFSMFTSYSDHFNWSHAKHQVCL